MMEALLQSRLGVSEFGGDSRRGNHLHRKRRWQEETRRRNLSTIGANFWDVWRRLGFRCLKVKQLLSIESKEVPCARLQTSSTASLCQQDLRRRPSLTYHWKSTSWIQEELSSLRGLQESGKSRKEVGGRNSSQKWWLARQEAKTAQYDLSPQQEQAEESNFLDHTEGMSTRKELGIFHKEVLVEEELLLPEDNPLALLKRCAKLKDLKGACRAHAIVVKWGFVEKDVSIGGALVNLYAKCGALSKAREVFNALQVRDIASWNALIAGYVLCGHAEEALECFDQMQCEGIFPDAVTFSCILNACGSAGLPDRGHEIHARIEETNLLGKNVVVANSLVMMYAKCGLLEKAQEVFDKLLVQDVVSWNSIITGYVQHGQGEQALDCFERMKDEGFSPNAVTFVLVLKACGITEDAVYIEEIRFEATREGLLKNNVVFGTALVGAYASCGLFGKAEEVLEELPVRTAVSWSALISGYVQHGHYEEAFRCFDKLKFEGFMPNGATFACILKACGHLGAVDKGHDIHVQVLKEHSLRTNVVVGNALVNMYAKCGLLRSAQEVFDELQVCNTISWNTLVSGYAEHGQIEEAFECFKQMQLGGYFPDAVTFVCMLKSCCSLGDLERGQNLHTVIVKEGFLEKSVVVANALIDMYAKCGLLQEAQGVFDKLEERDVYSWSALIAGYARPPSGQEAMYYFKQMQREGVSPNSVTFLCILKACSSIGGAHFGQELHDEIVKKGVIEKDMVVGSALVDFYANCGMLAEAEDVFNKMPLQDVVLWNALLAGYSLLGEYEVVSNLFRKMVTEGIQPDLVTFTVMLNTCSHGGFLDSGQFYFELLCTRTGFIPTIEHHTCMVDLFGRAGNLDKAVAVIKEMPFLADLTVWHIILSACHKWGIMKLGRWVLSHDAHLDELDDAGFISVSNISAAYMSGSLQVQAGEFV